MAENGQTPAIGINVQYVKDLSFENPRAPHSFREMDPPPAINVDVNISVDALQPPEVFEVTLNLNARATRDDLVFFVVELAYGCVCTVSGVPPEHLRPVLTIEIPRLLFPFARQVLADATRDGGFPPLMINPIDFAALYQQRMAEEMQQQGEGAQA